MRIHQKVLSGNERTSTFAPQAFEQFLGQMFSFPMYSESFSCTVNFDCDGVAALKLGEAETDARVIGRYEEVLRLLHEKTWRDTVFVRTPGPS